MDTSPLVIDEINAGAEFLKQLNDYQPVTAACWLRESEDEERYLFAALDGLTPETSQTAYGEVSRITGEMRDNYLDPFRVKLIGQDHPVAKAVGEIYRRYPGPIPTRLNGRVFAGSSFEEIYVYPPLVSKP